GSPGPSPRPCPKAEAGGDAAAGDRKRHFSVDSMTTASCTGLTYAERRVRLTEKPRRLGGPILRALAAIVRAISALNRVIGLTLSWLSLAVVLVCFAVVVQRYFLHVTQLWMQDLYVW